MAWSPRGNLKGPMGDNLVSSPTLVTDFNDAVNTNGKSQAFSVAGVMANGPPGGLQAYAPVLYLQSYASSTGGPVTRTGMQITFDRFNSGTGNPQAMWIRTVSNTSFGAWLRIVDEDMLDAVLVDALSVKADDNAVVHIEGTEVITGDKTFDGNVTILGDGNVFAFKGVNPTIQWQSNDQSQRIRMRAVLDDNSNDGWTLHKWNGFVWDQFLSADVTGLTINSNKVLTEQDTDSGTYTPTTVNVLNVASSSGGLCTYQRIGNSVDVAGSIIITPTAAGTRTTVQITIPIPSDFNDNTNCGGSAAAARGDYTDIVPCYMQANANNDRLVLSFIPASLGSYSVSFATTYPIL